MSSDTNPNEHKVSVDEHNQSAAIKYWQTELANRSDSTKDDYLRDFSKFLEYAGTTADQLIQQRQKDQRSKDQKTQRKIETMLKNFIAAEAKKGAAAATQQRAYAAVRSFFEMHYYPLRMRRGDYPTGESIGVRAATREAILKALDNHTTRRKTTATALIMFAKDSGLRSGDIRRLNYGDIAKGLESGADIITLTIVTQKAKTVAKTFLGEEAITTLKIYLDARRKGTKDLPPEQITATSPLFRSWSKNAKRIPRTTLANTIRNAFRQVNEFNVSPHSLRKYLQTTLEEAGVNSNWIDQILGHKLINSRDAYSKPTDEQLKTAYTKAYKLLRVYPTVNTETPKETTVTTTASYATSIEMHVNVY